MKIRQGFVSNSSSSSFCIYGTYLDNSNICDLFVNANLSTRELIEDAFNTYKFQEIVFKNKKLKEITFLPDENGIVYIGIPIENMKEDETKREFKNRSQKMLDDVFGKNVIVGEIFTEVAHY
jgi:hypothetical protein